MSAFVHEQSRRIRESSTGQDSERPRQSGSSIPQQLLRRLQLWLDVRKSFVLRQHESHHTAKSRLGEGGNRAWIDAMFVERIRTNLQFNPGPGELSQFRRQVVCSL